MTNIADYTERKEYQKAYSKANRQTINARKREWRKRRKAEPESKMPTSPIK
jgi:uncharacterized protein